MGTDEAAAGGRASRDLQVPGEVDVWSAGRYCDDRGEVSIHSETKHCSYKQCGRDERSFDLPSR